MAGIGEGAIGGQECGLLNILLLNCWGQTIIDIVCVVREIGVVELLYVARIVVVHYSCESTEANGIIRMKQRQ